MIIKLRLENYTPLYNSGITIVDLGLDSIVNLFIAQNGAGKTSIMKELNPLAPENANYEPGGRKYIEIKFPGRMYVLDSYTGVSDGHSFKVNGEELNKSGTYTSQKELVWTHFKLDSNRNKILSGLKVTDSFSSMTPNRRKEFLMWLYPNDTTFVMNVWNKLKIERNELKATIKNQVIRYTEENRKLQHIADCTIEELENRIKLIDSELKESLLVRGSLERFTLDPELKRKIAQFDRLAEILTVNKVSGFIETADEMEAGLECASDLLNRHQDNASVIQRVISEHAGMLEGMEEFLEDPLLFQHQSEHIQQELNQIKEEIISADQLLQGADVFNDPEVNFNGLEHVVEGFIAGLNRVVLLGDDKLTGGDYKRLQQRSEQIENELRGMKRDLEDTAHKLKHYSQAEAIDCPKCSFNFKVGITQKDIANQEHKRTGLVIQLEKLEKEKVAVTTKLDDEYEWYTTMMALYQFCRLNSDVPVLTQLVKEYSIGKSNVDILINALQAFMRRHELKRKAEALMTESSILDKRIATLQKDNFLDTAKYLANLENDLHKENNLITFYKDRVAVLESNLLEISNYTNNLQKLRELKEEVFSGLEREGMVNLRKLVDGRISILSDEKDEYLTSIINGRSLISVVTSISEDIDRMKRRQMIVETWMDELCPNKGFIGRLMADFIKTFCGNINSIIQNVWNTTLYVKPCSKDNGDLTYKFPVVVGDKKPVPDIGDCSLGQTGIIDFAARMTALLYHGIPYPLFMDEVGTPFDEIKRIRFFNYIKEFSQKKDCPQIFCVSHYLSSHGVFTNPNVVAMKFEGLNVPDSRNANSTII